MLSRRGGQVAMPGANQTTTTYGYETDSDLASLIHNYPGATADLVYAHTYSASGRLLTTTTSEVLNRYVVPDAPGTQTYAAANPLNQYPSVTPIGGSAVALSYDLNGNLTGDGSSTYTYDATNKLVSITGLVNASYGYDALDRRMSKTSSGVTTRFLHAGSDEIAEYSSAGVLLRRYVPGPGVDERAVLVDSGALSPPATALRFPHTDRLGSVVAVTSNTGAVSERFTYDGFGRSTSPMSGYPFRFTGQRLDSETGLMFYKARVYSQALGRFLQTDPIGTKDDLNLYAYVGNDPVNATDPTGQQAYDFGPDVAMGMWDQCGGYGCTDTTLGAYRGGVFEFYENGTPGWGWGKSLAEYEQQPSNFGAAMLIGTGVLEFGLPGAGALLRPVGRAVRPATASVDDLVSMMNERSDVVARIAEGGDLQYLKEFVQAHGSTMRLENGTFDILLQPGVSRTTVLHEWCHVCMDRTFGPSNFPNGFSGQDHFIEWFLGRHKNLFRLDE